MPDLSFRHQCRRLWGAALVVLLLLACRAGLAQSAPSSPSGGRPLEDSRLLSPDLEDRQRFREPDTAPGRARPGAEDQGERPPELTDEQVRRHPRIAEIIINTALQRRDWNTLARVLPLYRQAPGHDPLLVHYVSGALLRQQGRHGQAIAHYRAMLEADPALDYVRFDLAAMLFENRQYRQARGQFLRIRDTPRVAENFRALAEEFLGRIQQRQRLNTRVRVGLVHNDNVNQASDERYLTIGGWVFVKNRENMPRDSLGTDYSLLFDQERNLGGHHFLSWDLKLDGLHYFSEQAFNERAATLNLQYKWQDSRSWLYAGPMLDWRWLDGERYTEALGASAGYGRWLSPRWQATLHGRWFDKDYVDDGLADFGGDVFHVTPGLLRVLPGNAVLFAGLVWQREKLGIETESFTQRGANLGIKKQWRNGLDTLAYVQWGKREYRGENALFAKQRRDRRANVVLDIGHSRLRFWGIEPSLGFRMEKVDSNLPEIYSRTIRQYLLTFEKRL
ncbi:surface lipoprotein assembly modifier [Alcanivorax sp. 24]|uniref:surface lipoprotein assembly modifier n=1 Tax=Alcanivorax sp. 24 TaxID=2545266 RepID=UPI001414F2A0|nr:surface lipoprotein assembly modifier [Alcanivorax sp. 24]